LAKSVLFHFYNLARPSPCMPGAWCIQPDHPVKPQALFAPDGASPPCRPGHAHPTPLDLAARQELFLNPEWRAAIPLEKWCTHAFQPCGSANL
ncbi:MAG: hypothetical protein Q4A97_08565, partial [Comamonadaceae bacterium]|nr:hypothetical protein [Comamonadaceae bacterium]